MIGASILAISSERDTRRLIARALVSAGGSPSLIESGEQIESVRLRVRPDLVIFDVENREAAEVEAVVERVRTLTRAPVVLLSISSDNRSLFDILERRDLANLVAKHGAIRADFPSFDERELIVTCEKVLQRDIFGLEKYLGQWGVVIHEQIVTHMSEKAEILSRFEAYVRSLNCPESIVPHMISVADELILNAALHAPTNDDGGRKYEDWRASAAAQRTQREWVQVNYACNGQRLMLSVTDNFGNIARKELQSYLRRGFERMTPDEKPSGAGLGLSLAFRGVHQMVFNIHEGRRTEVIAGWSLGVKRLAEFRQVGKSLNMFWLPAEARPIEPLPSSSVAIACLPEKIDESTAFARFDRASVLDMSAVQSITPAGFEGWKRFLTTARPRLQLHGCPPDLVRAFAKDETVLRGVWIRSLAVDCVCSACQAHETRLMRPRDVPNTRPMFCLACKGETLSLASRDEYMTFVGSLGDPSVDLNAVKD